MSTTEVFSNESVLVKKSENLLKVQSELHEITTVEIFDIQGRLIDKKRGLNAREVTFSLSNITQVLLVKVTSNTGATATKKMIW
ncbi:T9SS sorting signal type C domain-containing protein [Flavobacterium aurantiibacter]|uniref:T9SS sorting signal type C domain-containing protein n=1 Tax=Flavobacterium aurantiibacter TaxID=2023067 RepID=UPI0013FE2063|nr:T9SS sorting signal type C domain-containing protein [Flavobacterium aurantiibacter]